MDSSREKVYLGLGSNLGNREGFIRQALEKIGSWPQTEVTSISSLYETEPVGPQDQDLFLNAAAELATGFEPEDLLDRLLNLESELGRVRTRHWGPRVIDLDLLLWGDRVINTTRLIIPHPEMINRNFVLTPLAEIAPEAVHPGDGRTVGDLMAGLSDDQGVRLFKRKTDA